MRPLSHASKPKGTVGQHRGAVDSGLLRFRDRQGALANGLHGLNPRNTGTREPTGYAEQPVREGLHKTGGQVVKAPASRTNRGVMRAVGLFVLNIHSGEIQEKTGRGKKLDRFTLARTMEKTN